MSAYQILIVVATVLIIFVGAALRMWWLYFRPAVVPARHRTGTPVQFIFARLDDERDGYAPAF